MPLQELPAAATFQCGDVDRWLQVLLKRVMEETDMKSGGWIVSAAILLAKNKTIHIQELADLVMKTRLTGLGVNNTTGAPFRTLRTQLIYRCDHPEWFSVVDNNVTLVDKEEASRNAEVRAVLKVINKTLTGNDGDPSGVLSVSPPAPPRAEDLEAPPAERVETTVSRIVRDTLLANQVKWLHNYACQICGHTIELADGSRYAEGHHIHPLGAPHNGPDFLENIICVCPNHHAACDLGAIRLVAAELRKVPGHSIGDKFIEYHNTAIYLAA